MRPKQSAFAIPSCARLYFVVVVDLAWLYGAVSPGRNHANLGKGIAYVVGRLGDVGESSRSRHFEIREKRCEVIKGMRSREENRCKQLKKKKLKGGCRGEEDEQEEEEQGGKDEVKVAQQRRWGTGPGRAADWLALGFRQNPVPEVP